MTDIVIKDIAEQDSVRLDGMNSRAITEAQSLTVTTETEYGEAGEFLKRVKSGIKAVELTFADMKSQANKAHKAVCEKENSFKKPLQAAEAIVKDKMQLYYAEQERIRREEEARIREAQKKLADEQLKRAAELEAAGKIEQAEAALQTANSIDSMSTVIETYKPKMEGVSAQDDWDIQIADESVVPAYISGFEIRKIDVAAIKRLVKAAKGKVTIPGIIIVPTKKISVRA